MPVRRRFAPATLGELHDFRSALRLDAAQTILINGGAQGGGPISQIYRTIRRAAPTSNVLVVCGRNSRLRWKIEREQHPHTRTFGFLEDIHRYVAASDLVLTKPGALSTYEALACRVPVLLLGIRGLMPQESGLFEAAARYDFGFAARYFEDLERSRSGRARRLESQARIAAPFLQCQLGRRADRKDSTGACPRVRTSF